MRKTARTGYTALVMLSALFGGCNDKIVGPPGRAVASTTTVKPPDQVDPHELIESSADIFGLRLPEGFHITRNTPSDITAVGSVPAEEVMQFVRDRVDADVQVGPSKTTFIRAQVKSPTRVVAGLVSFEVSRRGGMTQISGSLTPRAPTSTAPVLPRIASSGDDDDTPPPPPPHR